MSELWAKWEGQVINGGLPLRRLIGVSDHSGVFLTEAPAHNLPNAALKLVPAIPTLAESQLAYWNAAASLSHPRLLRLFAAGRCQLPAEGQGNLHFLYVLMEYADQNLAQLLEARALTEVEARETLPPMLDGLAFLHSKNLVQGQLKPSNILVVGEQLKLASDTIRPAGEAATSISMVSVYDPPEGRDGSFSTAGDVWALGVTLYEALTRTTPVRPDERSHGVVLPPDFPPASADVIRECLSRRPIDRPNVTALQAWLSGKVRYPSARSSAAAASVETASAEAAGAAAASALNRTHLAAAGTTRGEDRADVLEGARAAADETGVGREGSGATASQYVGGGGRAAPGNSGGAVPGRSAAFATGAADTTTGSAAGTGAGTAAGSIAGGTAATAISSAVEPAPGARSPNQGRITIRVERESIHEDPPQRRSNVPVVAAFAAVLAVLIIAWGVVRLLGHQSSASPPSANESASANTTQPTPQSGDSQAAQGSQGAPPTAAAPSTGAAPSTAPASPAEAAPKPQSSAPPMPAQTTPPSHSPASNATSPGATATASASSAVVHEEIPNVPHSALATIHGHVKVAVRVTVDPSGNVVDDSLDHAGPSHYFARVASQAARKWKFAPADQKSDRHWLVHFDFSRTGTTVRATTTRS